MRLTLHPQLTAHLILNPHRLPRLQIPNLTVHHRHLIRGNGRQCHNIAFRYFRLILCFGDILRLQDTLSRVPLEMGEEFREAEIGVDGEGEVELDGVTQGVGVGLEQVDGGDVVEDAGFVGDGD